MLDNMVFKSSNDRKMAEVLVQTASIVARNMVDAYYEQLATYLRDCQEIPSGDLSTAKALS